MQTKFNIGDKVRILDGDNIDRYVGGWIPRIMDHFISKVVTVESVKITKHGVGYKVEEIPLIFDERGLESVGNENEQVDCDDADLCFADLIAKLLR